MSLKDEETVPFWSFLARAHEPRNHPSRAVRRTHHGDLLVDGSLDVGDRHGARVLAGELEHEGARARRARYSDLDHCTGRGKCGQEREMRGKRQREI